jgi:fluoride exporter
MIYVWIGLGGFAGALSRYWLGAYIAQRWPSAFPRGTFVINISGALLLGLVIGLSGVISPALKVPVATGFLGAYTTFSTWMLETLRLTDSRSYLLAGANLLLTLAVGLAAATIGLYLGHGY